MVATTNPKVVDKKALEEKLRAFLEARYAESESRNYGWLPTRRQPVENMGLKELIGIACRNSSGLKESSAFSGEERAYLEEALELLSQEGGEKKLAIFLFLLDNDIRSKEDIGLLNHLHKFLARMLDGKVNTAGKSIEDLIGIILEKNLAYWNPRYFPKQEIARIDEAKKKRKEAQV